MGVEVADRPPMASADVASDSSALAARRGRDWRKLVRGSMLYSFGFALTHGILINFIVQELQVPPERFGIMEAIRETAGFLTAFSGAATMRVPEPVLASGCIGLVAAGVLGYSLVRSFPQLVASSFTWSVGFHLYHPLQQAMNLALAGRGEEGKRLGLLRSYCDLAALSALAFVFTLGRGFSFRQLFVMSAVALIAGAALTASVSRDIGHPNKPRLVWKSDYRLYYWLAFLEGCRKQFFITFAPFVLIRVFHFERETMALLMFINASLTLVLAPRFGRWIDRWGERRVLTANYCALTLVFLGYALIKEGYLLAGLYCLDSVLFFFAAALTTYLKKIAIPEDVMPTLAMGVTVNHIASVIVPLVGGFLWARFDYPLLFMIGMTFVVMLLASAQALRNVGQVGQVRPVRQVRQVGDERSGTNERFTV